MIGLVEIKPIEDRPTFATIMVDEKQIHGCTGYTIHHRIDEVPTCEIEMIVMHDYRHVCDVYISNLEDIAMLLDDKSFEELCELYKAKKEVKHESNSENVSV